MRWVAPFLILGRPLYATIGRAQALSLKFPSCKHHLVATTTVALFSASSSSSGDSATTPSSSFCESSSEGMTSGTGYLNAVDAAALDADLMSSPGFSLEQLMELAGLAVAEAVYEGIPSSTESENRKILVVCGPGNNGGDGLVAARHLYFFGNYDCVVVYPKRSKKKHFINLVQQCEDVGIPILDEMPPDLDSYDSIVDAIFGFSFKGEPREPFATILQQLQDVQADSSNNVQIVSVDVPSGWNVDEGDVANTGFVPDMLVSLTAPKLCTKEFNGRHFIGGRFLPPKVANKYNVRMPPYKGVSQVMEVTRAHIEGNGE